MSFNVEPSDVVEVVVHGSFFPQLAAWLQSQDMLIHEVPSLQRGDSDALRCFMLTPGPRRMAMLKDLE